MNAPMYAPSPPRLAPAPPDLILRLQVAREPLHATVLEDYFGQHPPPTDAHRLHVTRRCREDLGSHLDQLAAALQLGDAEVFSAYLRWLREVLASRCLGVDHTADALRVVHDWLRGHLTHAHAGDVLALLEHGIATLEAAERGTALIAPEPSATVQTLSRALLGGRRQDAEAQVLTAMAGGAALVDVSVDLLQPALYHVGLLWQQNRISVAQEHLATAITQTAMATGFAVAELAPPNGRTAAFACVEGNLHAVGLRMVSDAFEVAGWEASFLGASMPNEALIAFCGEARPELLGLSVSLPPQLPALRELIGRLRAELGNAAPRVLVGGQLVNQIGAAVRGLGADAWFSDARAVVHAASQ
jgi:MerR family transcriptional regulator, light-induced transcriptional regulator